MIYAENLNPEKFIEFMQQLIKSSSRKVYLILDNLRVHHSIIVKAWEEENIDKIALFFFLSYSPEKRTDEYLNCDLKQGLPAKKSSKNKETLQSNVQNHMVMLHLYRVTKYFKHKDMQYAA